MRIVGWLRMYLRRAEKPNEVDESIGLDNPEVEKDAIVVRQGDFTTLEPWRDMLARIKRSPSGEKVYLNVHDIRDRPYSVRLLGDSHLGKSA